ncbi:hypothetical protein HPB51_027478 [Rhipicephalus microplus]|uniref:Uncharacterized protein n=1 Tax=Rhipicephalus microplus TaxID=6941 RepID=A0A9J6D031_RHIMP|nr:hypothetical protein HPB51_027478 [Rhipicephalus microplus]
MYDDTIMLTKTFSRMSTVAQRSRSLANDREGTPDATQWESADVVVNVVASERSRIASRFHLPCLRLAYRCVGTLSMFGLMLFLLGAAIVCSMREALARSSPSFDNMQAIFTGGFTRKVTIHVEMTTPPTEKSLRAHRGSHLIATDKTSTTNSTTSETTTTTGDEACQLNTDSFICRSALMGWYYKENRCRSTAEDEYVVCAHFIGKLTSERDCRSRCFLFQKKNCAGFRTVLRPCSTSDLSRSWYYFNVSLGHCVQWEYPDGACPNITAGQGFKSRVSKNLS